MASTNTNQAGTSSARLTAQKEFLSTLQTKFASIKGNEGKTGVFVIPVFTDAGKETPGIVRTSEAMMKINPNQEMVLLASIGEMVYNENRRRWSQDVRYTFQVAPKGFLGKLYKPGQNIGGKIINVYTIGKGADRDVMNFGTEIPCVTEDGEIIYHTRRWTKDLEAEDGVCPPIANLKDINDARAELRARDLTESLNGKLGKK